jgi:NAD(P)H-dependent FMN reductase
MIGIICGSQRKGSNSLKLAHYLDDVLKQQGEDSSYLLDLTEHPLPLWDGSAWQKDSEIQDVWQPIAKNLQACEAFIVIAPEWGGMAPAAVKNLFLYAGTQEMGHKPALICAVSSGIGGTYPVSELRMSSFKNCYLNYIPDHLVVRNVQNLFLDPQEDEKHTKDLRERIAYSIKMLSGYKRALNGLRAEGIIDYKTYPFGM